MSISKETHESLLLSLIKEGNHDAFLELSKRYEGVVKRMAYSPKVTENEKDDLFQEGLIGLYKAAVTYDENSSATFSTFAYICIKHSIISALRIYYSNKNYPIRSSLSLDIGEDEISKIQGLGLITEPEKLMIEKESYEALMSKIDSELSAYERKVFKFFLQGMSYADISKRLQTSTKSVGNAIQRIRGKLKLLIG
ncbi:MAG: sigma-70 family RNA polymerase sigma factor [Clostridia bacterium]|nr:sigma-70 family RNA polymerase sigma factor [Clostridia bacterium]